MSDADPAAPVPSSSGVPPRLRPARHHGVRWLVVFGLPCVLIAWFAFQLVQDEPPSDLSDLQPAPRTLPAEDNGYLMLRKVAREFALSGGEELEALVGRIGDEDRPLTGEESARIARAVEEVWPRLVVIAEMRRAEAELPATLGDTSPPLAETRTLMKAVGHWTTQHSRAGDPDRALAETLLCLRHAWLVSEAGGPLVTTLTGASLRGMALHHLRTIVGGEPRPSVEALRTTLPALAACRPRAEAYAASLRMEARFMDQVIAAIQTDPSQLAHLAETPEPGLAKVRFLFKPQQTRRWNAEQIRPLIAHVDEPWSVFADEVQPLPNPRWFGSVPEPDNMIGRLLLQITTPGHRKLHEARLRDQTSISMHLVWCALQRYEREHGTLPLTLDALVPGYLPEVPRDFFNGEPIHYDPAMRSIWSPGASGNYAPNPEAEPPPFGRELDLRVQPPAAGAK